ncbi:Carboxypeptidase regulatory-like domain protein [uncultured archaeon]|nr:Carboxypeptidase regulatory-like domain protein [uncultured archaeon]
MGISEQIGGFYSAIEDKFYGAMDFLSDRGLPVYAVIDPVEERGVPFFPLAAALLLLLLFLLYGFLFLAKGEVTMTLSLTDSDTGATLSGVSISAKDEAGKPVDLRSSTFSDGQSVTIKRSIGARLVLEASKEGYENALKNVYFDKQDKPVSISLKKIRVQIAAELRLSDSRTGDPIAGADVKATISDSSEIQCTEKPGSPGNYVCAGAFDGEKARVTVAHPNYEQKELDVTFRNGIPEDLELNAKAALLMGQASLVVRAFDADTKQRLGNFTLQVYDAKSGELILDTTETDNDGEQIVKVQRGISARVVVEKQDYISYDSGIVGENQTLLSEEVVKEAYLKKGGNDITVSIIDAAGKPLAGITATLFNENGEVAGQAETGLAGEALFRGLDPKVKYYASAWQEGSLPAAQAVDLSKSNIARLTMQKGTASNSGNLTVYTADDKGAPVNDVALNFFLEDANGTIPLGIPPQKTDAGGRFSTIAPLNSTVIVKGAKDALEGEQKTKIADTFKNEAFITMREPGTIIKLTALDKDGKEQEGGFLSVVGGNDILFEGPYAKGGIMFNPKGNKYVKVVYSDGKGSSFEEEAYVEGRTEVSVSPNGSKGAGTAPEIEFLGIYSVDGKKLDGMVKGEDAYLNFRVAFAAGTSKNGIHVRIGNDNEGFADSQDAGITGFSATGASSFYGRSYSPQPAPGFEGLDFENSGSDGKYNKWLELYFTSPGEKIVKVRAKAKETASSPEIEVHYRAWSNVGSLIYRTPQDTELNLQQFTKARTSLYAETNTGKARILDRSAQCKNEFCASYKFIGSDGTEQQPENFRASLGTVYALEVALQPGLAGNVTVKATTQRQSPKIGFQGFAINDYSSFPDLNSQDTGVKVDNVPVQASGGQPVAVRLFFKPFTTENASVALQLISGEKVLNTQFGFNVFREKAVTMRTVPDQPVFGEDFAVMVYGDDKTPIEGAQVRLSGSDGSHLLTIAGSASANKGAGGRYLVKNTFSSGTIKYEISADGFRTLSGTIDISRGGILRFGQAKAGITIPKGQKSGDGQFDLSNLSGQGVRDLAFEVKPVGQLPEGMEIKALPLQSIGPNSTQKVGITATYSGTKDSAHAEATIVGRGRTDSGHLVTAEIPVSVDYNPKIPQDCMEFSKDKIVIFIASGSDATGYNNAGYGNSRYGTGAYGNTSYGSGAAYNSYGSGYGSQPIYPDSTGQSQPGVLSGTGSGSQYAGRNSSPYSQSGNYGDTYSGYYGSNMYYGSPYGGSYSGAGGYGGYPSNYYRYNGYGTTTQDVFTAKLAERQECQIPLDLKPEVIPQSQGQFGLNLESGAIKLTPQQASSGTTARRTDTQEVLVTVTNSMPRNYATQERFGFDIVFKMDGFEKSLPVDVVVWNPTYALEVVRNVELYLGPDDRGRMAAQVPLFATNVGQSTIENIDFHVSSATSRGNIELQVTPPFPIQFLQPGQSIMPPKTIVAQVTRNEKTTLSETKELEITGVIDGRTFSFGPVYVTAHASASQCLTVVPGNISFFSAKTEGALAKEITLRNTCSEEVRIVDISRPSTGNNVLYVAPVGMTLPPNSETRANLVLEANSPFQGPATLYLKGLLVRSGAPMDSNPVFVDLKIGPATLRGTGASEPMTLKVCEDDTGKETKSVRFPVIASGTNATCDAAYCDAVQLSAFIAARIEETINDAQKQVQNRSAEIQKADCSQIDIAKGYCSFDKIGVKPKQFFVYLSHDNVSPQLLKKALEQRQGSAKNYSVDYLPESGNVGDYLGGYSQVLLNSPLRGCGLYSVRLSGAVKVEGNRIVPDLMNILVDLSTDDGKAGKQLTEQCIAKVQNTNNFLPRDEGLTPVTKMDTWLGVAEAKDKALEDVSTDVAKTIFGSDKRAVTGDIAANKLALRLGKSEGYLVKIELEKGISQDNPVTVNAFVRESIDKEGKEQKDLAKSAGQAIKGLRENSFEGCIGRDESYLMLKSAKDNPKFNIEAETPLQVRYGTAKEEATCSNVRVTSDIKETFTLTGQKATAFDGLYALTDSLPASPFFKAASVPGQADNSTPQPTFELEAKKLDEKTNRFDGNARVCVIGSGQLQNAQGKEITVTATRKQSGEQGKGAQKATTNIGLAVCGIHPLAFMEKINGKPETKPNEYYYATFIWKGLPESINISNLSKISKINEAYTKASSVPGGGKPGVVADPESVAAKKKASNYYLGACTATSLITSLARPMIGWAAALFSVAADCVVPYVALRAEVDPNFKNVTDAISKFMPGFIKKPLEWVGTAVNTVLKPVQWALKLLGTATGLEKAEQKQAAAASGQQNPNEGIIASFISADALKDLIVSSFNVFGGKIVDDAAFTSKLEGTGAAAIPEYISKMSAITGNIGSSMKGELAKKMFGAADYRTAAPEVQAFLDDFVDKKIVPNMNEDLLKTLEANRKYGLSPSRPGVTASVSVDEAQKVITEMTLPRTEIAAMADTDLLAKLNTARQVPGGGKTATTPGLSDAAQKDVVEKTVAEAIDSAGIKSMPRTAITQNVAMTPPITNPPTTTEIQAAADAARDKMANDIVRKLETKIGKQFGTGDRTALLTELKATPLNASGYTPKAVIAPIAPQATTVTVTGYNIEIPEDQVTSAMNEMELKFKSKLSELLDAKLKGAPVSPPADALDELDKVAGKKMVSSAGETAKAKADVKDAKPKLLSWKGGLLFLKNILKEGAFGLLSNYIGMKAYDWSLVNSTTKAKPVAKGNERENFAASLQASLLGTTYKETAGTNKEIMKYRTYKVKVTTSAGGGNREITLELATEGIPKGAPQERVLDDCTNPGFDREMSEVFPGMIPDVSTATNFPEPFQKDPNAMEAHIEIAKSYLKKQPKGETYAMLIAQATRNDLAAFNKETILNLEALVTTIGIVKSGIGIDKKYGEFYIFGCDKKKQATSGTLANAKCASDKFVKYAMNECAPRKTDPACYFETYEKDSQNEQGGYWPVTPQEFTQIYNKWAGPYAAVLSTS